MFLSEPTCTILHLLVYYTLLRWDCSHPAVGCPVTAAAGKTVGCVGSYPPALTHRVSPQSRPRVRLIE
eukprot:13563771-Ditylum_brightwellii.AAC.1